MDFEVLALIETLQDKGKSMNSHIAIQNLMNLQISQLKKIVKFNKYIFCKSSQTI